MTAFDLIFGLALGITAATATALAYVAVPFMTGAFRLTLSHAEA